MFKLGSAIVAFGIFLLTVSPLLYLTLPSSAFNPEYRQFNYIPNVVATCEAVFAVGIIYILIGLLFLRGKR
jgi:hypothetical protein